MRRYQSFVVDSSRWERFRFRDDDVVITTPAKCGTTWMQTIVAMLLLDRTELGAPILTISPWLDALLHTDDDVFDLLDGQTHRRVIKTHTPLDGVPLVPSVTYIAMIRHPLDVALSYRDHDRNLDVERLVALRTAAAGPGDTGDELFDDEPEEPDAFLRWFIDNDIGGSGVGPYGLADYCDQVRTYWDARREPNVHLFHYRDMWNRRDAEMRRTAAVLGLPIDEERWPSFVEAAGLDSMRAHVSETAPDGGAGIWHSSADFFRVGGTRDWASLLDRSDIAHFHARLLALAGDATDWVLQGRVGLDEGASGLTA
jgi:hypothetical protein